MNDSPSRKHDAAATLATTNDAGSAEILRLQLLAADIFAEVFLPAPLSLSAGIFEIPVLSADRARASRLVAESTTSPHRGDWNCTFCTESVPDHFDLCWNYGALHVETRDIQFTPKRAGIERIVASAAP